MLHTANPSCNSIVTKHICSITSQLDSLIIQLKEMEAMQDWVNDNLFPGMFGHENPVPMMIFTDNSVLAFNPDSTLLSIFNPKEIGETDKGRLFYLTNEVNPNFMMMTMGAHTNRVR